MVLRTHRILMWENGQYFDDRMRTKYGMSKYVITRQGKLRMFTGKTVRESELMLMEHLRFLKIKWDTPTSEGNRTLIGQ